MNILIYAMVFLPIAAAFLSFLVGRRSKSGRDLFVWAVVGMEFVLSLLLFFRSAGAEDLLVTIPGICGFGLNFTVDGFRSIYAVIAALMWLVTSLLSPEYFAHYRNRNRYYLFLLVTLGATEAVFLSADLYTTFVFFEMMSFSSYVWVVQEETDGAVKASESFLGIGVIGGLVALMGVFLLYHLTGDLSFVTLRESCAAVENRSMLYAAGGCLLFGFGAKAGLYPLHIWLPKAHPVAPAPASALLSGILIPGKVSSEKCGCKDSCCPSTHCNIFYLTNPLQIRDKFYHSFEVNFLSSKAQVSSAQLYCLMYSP